jgi:drug/metabolite transporter (DMT)-like permease
MIPAILTALLFALSAASAGRSTRLLGGLAANFARLCLATCWLALWAHVFGRGTEGPSFVWFLVSGVVGFGLGDLGLYAALPRLGARLSVLLNQCLAAPFAAVVERMWLGTALSAAQSLWGAVTLAGVAVALWPGSKARALPKGHRLAGTLFGVVAAIGQGGGAVITRKAYSVAREANFPIDGGTAAFQRILGGISLTVLVVLLLRGLRTWRHRSSSETQPALRTPRPWRRAWPWVIVNSLAGPSIGVACYQWALSIAPTGIVLPIVATTPLLVIPFTFVLEGERPSIQSLIGGVIAVGGAVALALT